MIGSALMKLLLLVCKLMNFLPVRCHVFFVLLLKISAETVYLSGSSYRNILRGHLHTSVSQKSVAELSIIQLLLPDTANIWRSMGKRPSFPGSVMSHVVLHFIQVPAHTSVILGLNCLNTLLICGIHVICINNITTVLCPCNLCFHHIKICKEY